MLHSLINTSPIPSCSSPLIQVCDFFHEFLSGFDTPADPDEVQITTDPTLNFLQLAIQTCQRAGWGAEAKTAEEEKHNKASRDAWLRLASRYRARIVGGEIMRDVCLPFYSLCVADEVDR